MAEAFTQSGKIDFKLVIPMRIQPKEMENVDLKEFYQLKNKIEIVRLPCVDFLNINCPLPVALIFYYLQIVTYCASVLIFLLLQKSGKIYTRDFYLLPALLLTGREIYYEAHYFPANKLAMFLHKLFFPRLKGVVALTAEFRKFFDSFKFKYRKLMVSHDASDPLFFGGYDPAAIVNQKKLLKIGNKTVIGYIGNLFGLGEDKGGKILVKAFKTVRRSFPNTTLLVVGGSDLKNQPGIRLIGRVGYNQMPLWFNLVDIGVIPFPDRPHFRHFMSPLKLFDYLACGKPIVTSDFPCLREVISNDNAVFVRASDSKSLALGLTKLLKNRRLAARMGKNNYLLAKKYTWQNRAEAILKFLD